MVTSPDLFDLPYELRQGVKYFELVAEPVERELLPGLFIRGWGYNGSIPGPTIKVYQGDYVNIRVYNSLPEATSVHWHGLDVPNNMDGAPDVEPTPKIKSGCYFDYHFEIINPPGTHMYHTHFNVAKQEMMGLAGGLIILDPNDYVDRDYFIMLQEFAVKGLQMGVLKSGSYEVDPLNDDLQFFTINGRCFPFTSPLPVNYGDVTRIRLANPAMKEHPIHLHGHQFVVVATDGNEISPCARMRKNTIPVASGETWDFEFYANNPGCWPLHCHIPHHSANNMTKEMGGMFTVVKYK
ncbi:multicopper oxidase family protein [Sporomusa acidovorans]|uniref:multicopper oxidase family protein n=1 Tax=Sporomusa acidovorans TaxID=112900 RepID=UPI00088C4BB9|nr:copper oxidase [Sporomusa acidovorans]OZC18992.1 multicopper oxidase mco [Sporomusa acidovorans DSM 3132]SDD72328.1 Multicopper oxidase [Sporomusa acidovorans]